MSRKELANALRRRLAEKFAREERDAGTQAVLDSFLGNVKSVSDENVIAGYLKCSVCGRASMSIRQAAEIAEDCGTADEWVRRVATSERFFGCGHDIAQLN